MLILSRKTNESIIIGDTIEILIKEIKGDQVKLGIIAPKNISVHRAELYRQIQAENRQAAKIDQQELDRLEDLFEKRKKNPL